MTVGPSDGKALHHEGAALLLITLRCGLGVLGLEKQTMNFSLSSFDGFFAELSAASDEAIAMMLATFNLTHAGSVICPNQIYS